MVLSLLFKVSTPLQKVLCVDIWQHCHYDHIGGIEAFSRESSYASKSSSIVASSHDQDFILKDLPTHSLCRFKDPPIETPKYEVTHWAHDFGKLYANQEHDVHMRSQWSKAEEVEGLKFLGITLLHTPGHTPDSLAWWDEEERWLYS
jgi:glyoxylase-like metal-dependent hydrolase (beta-lactamase superfamily II)